MYSIEEQVLTAGSGAKCLLRKMRTDDVPKALSLREGIYLTPENMDEKLDNGSPLSFQNSGGFFVRETETSMMDKMSDPDSLFSVCDTEDASGQDMISFIWISRSMKNKAFLKRSLMENGSCDTGKLSLFEQEDAVEFMEFILSHQGAGADFHGLDIVLYVLQQLREQGIRQVFFQVYSIIGEWREEGYRVCNSENFPSTHIMEKLGCRYAGFFRLPPMPVGERKFDGLSRVYILDL